MCITSRPRLDLQTRRLEWLTEQRCVHSPSESRVFFALSTTTFRRTKAPDNSYEARGAIKGLAPPVPGFALSGI